MGYKSTLEITRADALTKIRENLDACSDEGISNVLEALNDDTSLLGWGLNFTVVAEYRASGEFELDASPQFGRRP